MTKTIHFNVLLHTRMSVVLGFLILLSACNKNVQKVSSDMNKANATWETETIWNIKAINAKGKMLDIKAFDKSGNVYAVKAIQDTDQKHLLDIKALVAGKRLPVKILVSEDKYSPVKAIAEDGTIYDIKALNQKGDKLDVKGISRSGSIIHIKAINKRGEFYGVKAISPNGQLRDVKGVKMTNEQLEVVLSGVKVYAHIKALPQPGAISDQTIWHVKAIHPKGKTIDVKAFDKDGNKYDVKAIQDSDQQHLLDVRALVGGKKLPIKILVSDDRYAPVKAIGLDGTLYDIKAFTLLGEKLDVKGIGHRGNIIDIKAINKVGEFYGIKAISAEGQMYDVKGVKMSKLPLEAMVNGVKVHAHIKALPQVE